MIEELGLDWDGGGSGLNSLGCFMCEMIWLYWLVRYMGWLLWVGPTMFIKGGYMDCYRAWT